jgi:HK97 family phage major capsid protein
MNLADTIIKAVRENLATQRANKDAQERAAQQQLLSDQAGAQAGAALTQAVQAELVKRLTNELGTNAFLEWKRFHTYADRFANNLRELAFVKEAHAKVFEVPVSSRKTPMSATSGAAGGYLEHPSFVPEMPVSGEDAHIRPGARTFPSHTMTQGRPYWHVTTPLSPGQSALQGGLTLSLARENAQPSEVEPLTDQTDMVLSIRGVTIIASNSWLADSSAGTIEAQLFPLVAKAIEQDEEHLFLNGTGDGQPLGILNAGCAIKVNRASGDAIAFADYTAMMSSLLPESINRVVGLCSLTALNNLLQLKDGTGRGVVLTTTGANGRPQLFLGHHPLFVTEHLPPLGTPGDFILADRSYYDICDFATLEQQASGIYRTLALSNSPHAPAVYFKNQTAFLVAQRVDGRPRIAKPVTLADGTTLASPFVILN